MVLKENKNMIKILNICKIKAIVSLNSSVIKKNSSYKELKNLISPGLTKGLNLKRCVFLVKFFKKLNLILDKATILITENYAELAKKQVLYFASNRRQLAHVVKIKSRKTAALNLITSAEITEIFFVCLGLVDKTKIDGMWHISQSDFKVILEHVFLIISFDAQLSYTTSSLRYFPQNIVDTGKVLNCNKFTAALRELFGQLTKTEQRTFFGDEFIAAGQELLVEAKIIIKIINVPANGIEYVVNPSLNSFFLDFNGKSSS